jgi:hypothetical protein
MAQKESEEMAQETSVTSNSAAKPDASASEPAVINTAWLLQFIEQKTARMVEIARAKNADYAGASSDPFGNFKNVEMLGIATVEQGFLARMTDKLARIASLTRRGAEAMVKGETVEDTLLDLANYSLLLAAYLASKSR